MSSLKLHSTILFSLILTCSCLEKQYSYSQPRILVAGKAPQYTINSYSNTVLSIIVGKVSMTPDERYLLMSVNSTSLYIYKYVNKKYILKHKYQYSPTYQIIDFKFTADFQRIYIQYTSSSSGSYGAIHYYRYDTDNDIFNDNQTPPIFAMHEKIPQLKIFTPREWDISDDGRLFFIIMNTIVDPQTASAYNNNNAYSNSQTNRKFALNVYLMSQTYYSYVSIYSSVRDKRFDQSYFETASLKYISYDGTSLLVQSKYNSRPDIIIHIKYNEALKLYEPVNYYRWPHASWNKLNAFNSDNNFYGNIFQIQSNLVYTLQEDNTYEFHQQLPISDIEGSMISTNGSHLITCQKYQEKIRILEHNNIRDRFQQVSYISLHKKSVFPLIRYELVKLIIRDDAEAILEYSNNAIKIYYRCERHCQNCTYGNADNTSMDYQCLTCRKGFQKINNSCVCMRNASVVSEHICRSTNHTNVERQYSQHSNYQRYQSLNTAFRDANQRGEQKIIKNKNQESYEILQSNQETISQKSEPNQKNNQSQEEILQKKTDKIEKASNKNENNIKKLEEQNQEKIIEIPKDNKDLKKSEEKNGMPLQQNKSSPQQEETNKNISSEEEKVKRMGEKETSFYKIYGFMAFITLVLVIIIVVLICLWKQALHQRRMSYMINDLESNGEIKDKKRENIDSVRLEQ